MKKISGTLGAPELPDVSSKNNYRENFASAFADNQFGRNQTIGRKRLQAGGNGGLMIDQPESKRLAQSGVCMPATAPDGYRRDKEGYGRIRFRRFQPPAIVIVLIRMEPVFFVPRTRTSSPIATISLKISLRLPAMVISSTGYWITPRSTQ